MTTKDNNQKPIMEPSVKQDHENKPDSGPESLPFNTYLSELSQTQRQDEDTWVVTYIDILTLLLTLFVVMLYLAKTDTEKFQQFTHSLGIEVGAAPSRPNVIPAINTGLPMMPAPQAEQQSEIETLGKQLMSDIMQQGLDDSMAVMVSKSQVEVRIKDNILFPSGEAELLNQGSDIITKLAGLLSTKGSIINVEGHTDNVPIKNTRFPSNWELSASRASMVVRELIRHGIPAQRLRATAYADTHPIASNLTVSGRSQNRRVSLVIEMEKTAPAGK
jgi:chemotaxis protein MotB